MELFTLYANKKSHYGVVWLADKPKGVICLVHGMGEYAERYDTTARYYASHGYHVIGVDLPGYGHSTDVPGYLGTRKELLYLLQAMINYAKYRFIHLPIFFYGHSLGGNLCLTYRLYTKRDDIAGYILSSPWIGMHHSFTPLKIASLKALAKISPKKLYNIKWILKAEDHMKDVGADYIRDDLLRPYVALRAMINRQQDCKKIEKTPKVSSAPLFIFQGVADQICSFSAVKKFAAANEDICTFTPIENCGHECMHKPEYWDILEKSLSFMEKAIKEKKE